MMNKTTRLYPNNNFCSLCGELVFIERGLNICWPCIKKDPKLLEDYKKAKKEGKKPFITFMGTPLDYEALRNWIKCPFTLNERETEAYKQFVKDHGQEHSSFGWFFEVYWKRDCQLMQNEIDCLLKIVDEMESTGNIEEFIWSASSLDVLYIENHLRYMAKQLMDDEDRYDFFEVFINQRTNRTVINDD